ncbi:MAG: beta-ketoacyl-[acyl-carrier-protein] synthase family protein [Spirochaetota bacterium]|nr:MAG: beta-ketoacyl-[acyl-carrier-protein] synthase family protein [Spirochaetota bacterium]
MEMKRAVITGLGPVSSIGIGNDEFWTSTLEGKGYFRNIDFQDVEIEQYKSKVCSPIDNFSVTDYLENPRKLRRAGKATQYTILGAYLALKDAGFEVSLAEGKDTGKPTIYSVDVSDPSRCGVIIGQSMDNADILVSGHNDFIRERGPKKVGPFTLPHSNINAGASLVAEWFFLKGTNLTIATACSSATHAIGSATLHIRNGIEDLIVSGGTDAPIEPYFFCGFDVINALSCRNDDPMSASRPWDKDRDGFVVGEGAGIIVLEELGHAIKRGARIYGEVLGYGYTADAYNIVAPNPYGTAAADAVKKALNMGKVSIEEVEYINAHGTSTPLNDPTESFIIKKVFGDYAYKIPISSSKSYFGHTLGAAGGLETVVTMLAMEKGVIPPTLNLDNPDVEYTDTNNPDLDKRCDLDYVPKKKRDKQVGIALKNSFGFGGQNGVLLLKKFEN